MDANGPSFNPLKPTFYKQLTDHNFWVNPETFLHTEIGVTTPIFFRRLNHLHRIVFQDSINVLITRHVFQPWNLVAEFCREGCQNGCSIVSDLALLWFNDQGIIPQPRTTESQGEKCGHVVWSIDGGAISTLNLDLVILDQPVITTTVDTQGIHLFHPKDAIVKGVDVRIACHFRISKNGMKSAKSGTPALYK